MVGGGGGDGSGGVAQLLTTGFDTGPIDAQSDASARGGDAGFGTSGGRGDGGNAVGGTSRIEAGGTAITLSERSEEHTSELQSLMRISYAVFSLKKQQQSQHIT